MAICWLIDQAIGHGDAEPDLRFLESFYKKQGYTEEQSQAAIAEAADSYRADRGKSLIDRAFPKESGAE